MAAHWLTWFEQRQQRGPTDFDELCWKPPADVYQVRGGWLVKFDLAGIRPEDVRITLSGSRLTVSGIRKDWKMDETQQQYRLEIAYSQFERSVEFPCTLDRAQTSIDYRDGMLIVRLVTEEGAS
jgi:HSP20 family protein